MKPAQGQLSEEYSVPQLHTNPTNSTDIKIAESNLKDKDLEVVDIQVRIKNLNHSHSVNSFKSTKSKDPTELSANINSSKNSTNRETSMR